MRLCHFLLPLLLLVSSSALVAQPNWPAIKSNAVFTVADTSYATPYIQPVNVGGWEDGLYMTRDGKHLYSTYLPVDAFSWLFDLLLNPICFNFHPYYRGPLLGVDTLTNIFGCPNYMHSDIIIASRADSSQPFTTWQPSNLQTPFSFDGGAQGVLLNPDTFDVFVFTQDGVNTQSTDIMFMRNVPVNPNTTGAVPLFSTTGQEDNPHIERLNDSTMVIIFDRDREMFYSLSTDNGTTWQTPTLITNVLNDQAPYDVQPHLWFDGTDWWVYFCADSNTGVRGIYKSKQLVPNDWNSWGPKQLVIEGSMINGGYGVIAGVGEPTLTKWGDLSFVVVYADMNSADTTDMFDCDPWFLPKKNSPLSGIAQHQLQKQELTVYPNPTSERITIRCNNPQTKTVLVLYNAQGKAVREFVLQQQTQLDLTELPPGVYLLNDRNGIFAGKTIIRK